MSSGGTGFLSRWSQRKTAARQGEQTPLAADDALQPPETPAGAPRHPVDAAPPARDVVPTPSPEPAPVLERPAPSLDDVAALDAGSHDYSRFVSRGVQPEVKNAALKKLFSDPHFNVMDGLDTYIEDFGRPDPLPAAWLKNMAQAQFLHLLDTEDEQVPAKAETGPPELPHENTDLRLQPHDATGREEPDPGPSSNAGREC